MARSYDKQFKIAAVKLVLENNMTSAEVSKELDIHYNSLYRWISEYEEYGESAFPGHGSALYSYQYEIKKLKAENLELRKELELLKKRELCSSVGDNTMHLQPFNIAIVKS